MSQKRIAVVGALGYGGALIEEVLKKGASHNARLAAVVDVSPGLDDEKEKLASNGVRTYKSMEEMYEDMDIDLVIVASPIGWHSAHACMAMEKGSHVLIEKPVAGCMEDAEEIAHMSKITGKKALVGFQLLYDNTIRRVKEIIMSGCLGGLLDMKCIVLWPRDKAYFARSSWAGKIADSAGRLTRDSVANNATAHHVMAMLYFAGRDMLSAGRVDEVECALYRTNEIETFDTCAIKCTIEGGIGMLMIASHATETLQEPKFMLWFEKGYIECAGDTWTMTDSKGNKEIIGKSNHNCHEKIWHTLRYLDNDTYDVICTLEAATEHTRLIEDISDFPVEELKDNLIEMEDGYLAAKGLQEKLNFAYDNFTLP